MKYLVTKRSASWWRYYFQVTDEEGNELFRINPALSAWTLQDTFGVPIATLCHTSFLLHNAFEIQRAGEVTATIQGVRGRGKPRYDILLATGEQLMASSDWRAKKYDVRSAEGQLFCGLEGIGKSRAVEVGAGAELVLAFCIIGCFIKIQEISRAGLT